MNYGKLSLIKFCFSSFFGFFSGDQGCGLPFVRKTRWLRLRSTGNNKIFTQCQISWYSQGEILFWWQVVESVQLLSMTDPKDEKGYYALKGEFHFGTSKIPFKILSKSPTHINSVVCGKSSSSSSSRETTFMLIIFGMSNIRSSRNGNSSSRWDKNSSETRSKKMQYYQTPLLRATTVSTGM